MAIVEISSRPAAFGDIFKSFQEEDVKREALRGGQPKTELRAQRRRIRYPRLLSGGGSGKSIRHR